MAADALPLLGADRKQRRGTMNKPPGFDLVERARALAPLIAREADEIERTRRLTAPVVAALVENGLYRALLPKSAGGAEVAPEIFMQMLEEIAKADASTAWCLGQCCVCAMTAAYLDPDAANEIFSTPPTASSPGARSRMRRMRCPAAIASPGAGILPAARIRRIGSARMCRSSRPTARGGASPTARRKCAPSCFRCRALPCTTSGT